MLYIPMRSTPDECSPGIAKLLHKGEHQPVRIDTRCHEQKKVKA